MPDGMLQLVNVTTSFSGPDGRVVALDSVSLAVSPGDLLTIRGPSGCGKSTLLLTAAGLLRPDEGDVIFAGDKHIYGLAPDERSRMRSESIGFVFQQYHLIPYLTVKENIITPALSSFHDDPDSRAQALLEQFGLADRAGHVPSQLSTGQRQRTALARALFNNPGIIMADEPTGNLDENNARIVLDHLSTFVSGGGCVLLVTHDEKAAGYATRSMDMEDGCLH